MNKTAFISGISGQDGAYLAKYLIEKNYQVIGGDRRTASGSLWRLEKLGILGRVTITDFELAEFTNIYRTIEKYQIDEFYNLAAQSFVGVSFEMPTMTSDITGLGVVRILEAIKTVDSSIKFYQASSSEMFGKTQPGKQNENTPFYPRSPYGIAKLFGHWITVNYREAYNMFCCSGILFNHESPLRGEEFITRKVAIGVSKIFKGEIDSIEVGNINAMRDWGYAGDYIRAMYLMLQYEKPDNWVVATGETHTVREFIEGCFNYVGMKINWIGHGIEEKGIDENNNIRIKINPKYYRPAEVDCLRGDNTKVVTKLNWKPSIDFNNLIKLMMDNELVV